MPESSAISRGSLKVYLGYAAGVGKTFQMLADAQAAAQRGEDVVLAYFEPHARPDTIAQAQALEAVPHKKIEYRGKLFDEMDTDAVLRRSPKIALVDELAHTNIPGAARTKRWEDVQVLLCAGVEVWTTVNVQHIESLNDQIWQITGIQVRETVPDWVIRQAAEIIAVDVTPDALLNRLKRGAIYKPEMVQKALTGFFKGSNLGALRELALRQAAHEVDLRQSAYDETSAFQIPRISEPRAGEAAETNSKEHILIHITADASTAMLIAVGAAWPTICRRAVRLCSCNDTEQLSNLPADQRVAVEKHLRFARSLQIETRVITGKDIAKAVVEFARQNKVTQIFVVRPQTSLGERLRRKNYIENIVRLAQDLQATVVADRSRRATA